VFRISECIDSLSLPPQNIGRKTKRSRPSNLKELLLLAVKRMMFPGVCHLEFCGLMSLT